LPFSEPTINCNWQLIAIILIGNLIFWGVWHQLSSLTAALAVFLNNGPRQRRQRWVETTAPIVVIGGGVGGLCQQWSSSAEAAVGWS
jgi:hypothetical protein